MSTHSSSSASLVASSEATSPVDALFGSYGELVASYRSLLVDYDESAQRSLFAGNARAVYGIKDA